MGNENFKEALQKKKNTHFFLCELRTGRKIFEEWHLPEVEKLLGVTRTIHIETEEEWQERAPSLTLPSLFSEANLFLLWGVKEVTAWQIQEEFRATFLPFYFFFFSEKVDEKKWRDVPRIIVDVGVKEWERLCRSKAQEFGISLSGGAEKKLASFVHSYNLSEEDLAYFFSLHADKKRIGVEEVELFFERNERVLLFRFLDAVGEKEVKGALHYLHLLFRVDFSPTWLLAQLARRFRLVLQCHETGEYLFDLGQGKKLHPFEGEKILRMKEKYSLSEVSQAFHLLRAADRQMKTESVVPQTLLVQLVVDLMTPSERKHEALD